MNFLKFLLAFLFALAAAQAAPLRAVTADIKTTNAEGRTVFALSLYDAIQRTRLAGRDFQKLHGRIMHIAILGEDATQYGHVHPDDFPSLNQPNDTDKGIFHVEIAFRKSGRYVLRVDAQSSDGRAIAKNIYHTHTDADLPAMSRYRVLATDAILPQPSVYVYGLVGREIPGLGQTWPDMLDPNSLTLTNGVDLSKALYEVSMATNSTSVVAANVPYTFSLTYRKRVGCRDSPAATHVAGLCFEPADQLDSILGQPLHAVVVRQDLSETFHLHGHVPGSSPSLHHGHHDAAGPFHTETLEFIVQFPVEGQYSLVVTARDGATDRAIVTLHTANVV